MLWWKSRGWRLLSHFSNLRRSDEKYFTLMWFTRLWKHHQSCEGTPRVSTLKLIAKEKTLSWTFPSIKSPRSALRETHGLLTFSALFEVASKFTSHGSFDLNICMLETNTTDGNFFHDRTKSSALICERSWESINIGISMLWLSSNIWVINEKEFKKKFNEIVQRIY